MITGIIGVIFTLLLLLLAIINFKIKFVPIWFSIVSIICAVVLISLSIYTMFILQDNYESYEVRPAVELDSTDTIPSFVLDSDAWAKFKESSYYCDINITQTDFESYAKGYGITADGLYYVEVLYEKPYCSIIITDNETEDLVIKY